MGSSPVAVTAKRNKQEAEFKAVLEMISRQDWPELLRLDELNREMAAGRVFGDFTAMQPNFPPTFKRTRDLAIDVAISTKSTNAYFNPKRLPSHTDRVLYKSLPGFAHRLTELGFESCEDVGSSDHKPVRAYFALRLPPDDTPLCRGGSFTLLVDRLQVVLTTRIVTFFKNLNAASM